MSEMRRASFVLAIAFATGCASAPTTVTHTVAPTQSMTSVAPAPVGGAATPRSPLPTILATAVPQMPTLPSAPATQPPEPLRFRMSAMTIVERAVLPKVSHVVSGHVVSGTYPERTIAAVAWSGLDCGTYPVATREGRFVAYGSARERTRDGRSVAPDDVKDGDVVIPTVRLTDLVTGTDSEIDVGACNPAWSPTGRLAFVQGLAPAGTVGQPYPGRIAVREALGAPVELWSDPGEYVGLQWVGRRLLAYRMLRWPSGGRYHELVVLDESGKMRSFGIGTTLVAVAPDGERIVITTVPADPYMGWATARLVRLSDGRELAALALNGIANLSPSGSWREDSIVTTLGIYPGGSTHPGPEFVVLDVASSSITIRGVFWLAAPELVGPGPFATLRSPYFIDGARVGASFGWMSDRYIECDLDALRCVVSAPVDGGFTLLRR